MNKLLTIKKCKMFFLFNVAYGHESHFSLCVCVYALYFFSFNSILNHSVSMLRLFLQFKVLHRFSKVKNERKTKQKFNNSEPKKCLNCMWEDCVLTGKNAIYSTYVHVLFFTCGLSRCYCCRHKIIYKCNVIDSIMLRKRSYPVLQTFSLTIKHGPNGLRKWVRRVWKEFESRKKRDKTTRKHTHQ